MRFTQRIKVSSGVGFFPLPYGLDIVDGKQLCMRSSAQIEYSQRVES